MDEERTSPETIAVTEEIPAAELPAVRPEPEPVPEAPAEEQPQTSDDKAGTLRRICRTAVFRGIPSVLLAAAVTVSPSVMQIFVQCAPCEIRAVLAVVLNAEICKDFDQFTITIRSLLFVRKLAPYQFHLTVQALLIETPICGLFQKVRSGVKIVIDPTEEISFSIRNPAPYDRILCNAKLVPSEMSFV